jgi:hypothetical protein
MTEDASQQPYRANDPKQVEGKKSKLERARKRQEDDFRKLLSQIEFRRWLWTLMNERCQIMVTPYSSNGSAMSHAAGRGDIGRELWAAIEAVDPKLIPQMMLEYAESQA